MRISEVRALANPQLLEGLTNAQKEMLNLRFRLATRQLDKPSELTKARRDIARYKTVIRERNLRES